MVFRLHITYDEFIDILDVKYLAGSTKEYTLAPGIYELFDFNMMVKPLPPKVVKVNISIGDIRVKSNLTTNKTTKFTKKSSFYTILGYTESDSGVLYVFPGNHRSNRPISITEFNKLQLKCDCIDGTIVNGIRKPIEYSFVLSSPPGQKIPKNQELNFLKR